MRIVRQLVDNVSFPILIKIACVIKPCDATTKVDLYGYDEIERHVLSGKRAIDADIPESL